MASQDNTGRISLTLYVAGDEPNSHASRQNLSEICAELGDICAIEVVDVYKDFNRALQERVVVTPTLIVTTQAPESRSVFYGTLHKKDVVRQYLLSWKNNNGTSSTDI